MDHRRVIPFVLAIVSCSASPTIEPPAEVTAQSQPCRVVPKGFGEDGPTRITADTLVTGLTVPWGVAFINERDFLVTERPGSIRIVRSGAIASRPVLQVTEVSATAETGLLGIAVHPQFEMNRLFYVYYTARKGARDVNRVERYRLVADSTSAESDRIIIDDIPAGLYHDGGRIRFGPDGMLYIGTGDAREPDLAQDLSSSAGKILRLTAEGEIPPDNPFVNSPVFVSGVRNIQAFDWLTPNRLVVADHGPSGELGRRGHDELSIAKAGANLGWPHVWQCGGATGITGASLVWEEAAPPGGLTVYNGAKIPAWRGSVLMATLRSEHLQRISLDGTVTNEVYLRGTHGRLREVVQAPDGSLLVTTSNCDGRGQCPPEGDVILRITGE